tara:strand:- start:5819 stop:6319 length:501 start_codon:yes stop_codon:yes gene_type:complete
MAKMPMKKDPKTGKMVPAFAIDGKGKMQKGGPMKKAKGMSKGGKAGGQGGGMSLADLKRKLEEDEVFASKVRKMFSPTKKQAGGAMKKTKGMAKGGAAKKQMGGMMKKTKGMAKGGATKKQMGGAMKKTKGYQAGGKMKKTKGMARGGMSRGMGAATKGGRYSRSG